MMLIAIIGVDLAGKSTQVLRLKEFYTKKGFSVASVGLKEKPTVENILKLSRAICKKPNNFPFGLDSNYYAMAYNCDFLNHYCKNIIPLFNSNIDLILSDRYTQCYKAYAYAVNASSRFVHTFLDNIVINPNLQICLDINYDEVMNRINQYRQQKNLNETEKILNRLIKYYQKICALDKTIVVVDASKSIDEVTNELIKQIDLFRKNHE